MAGRDQSEASIGRKGGMGSHSETERMEVSDSQAVSTHTHAVEQDTEVKMVSGSDGLRVQPHCVRRMFI